MKTNSVLHTDAENQRIQSGSWSLPPQSIGKQVDADITRTFLFEDLKLKQNPFRASKNCKYFQEKQRTTGLIAVLAVWFRRGAVALETS